MSTVDALTGIIPVAVAGGLALGFTQKALDIPNQTRRKTRKRTRQKSKSNMWKMPKGMF